MCKSRFSSAEIRNLAARRPIGGDAQLQHGATVRPEMSESESPKSFPIRLGAAETVGTVDRHLFALGLGPIRSTPGYGRGLLKPTTYS